MLHVKKSVTPILEVGVKDTRIIAGKTKLEARKGSGSVRWSIMDIVTVNLIRYLSWGWPENNLS